MDRASATSVQRILEAAQPADPSGLRFEDVATIAQRVANAPPRRFQFAGVWPAGDRGIVGAAWKAGKSWIALDAAIATSGNTHWLGRFPCDHAGPVLIFWGEGSEGKLIRRLQAVARAHDVNLDDLPIRICPRVPHISNDAHIAAVERELEQHPASLTIVDPFYLAARGATASSLYEMGTVLERLGTLAEDAGSTLMIPHHNNRSRDARGTEKLSGAGPAEWGRVLCTVEVERSDFHPDTQASIVTLKVAFEGDEIPATSLRQRRTVWADDPLDLSSQLNYKLEQLADKAETQTGGLKPSTSRVLAILQAADTALTGSDVQAITGRDATGIPLRRRTVYAALEELRKLGHIRSVGTDDRGANCWAPVEGPENA